MGGVNQNLPRGARRTQFKPNSERRSLSGSLEKSCASDTQLQLSSDRLHNPAMCLCRRAASVHRDHPLRLSRCNRHVTVAHASEKAAALLLEAILVGGFARPLVSPVGGVSIAPPRTPNTHGRIRLEEDGQVGLHIATKDAIQRQHGRTPELAPA